MRGRDSGCPGWVSISSVGEGRSIQIVVETVVVGGVVGEVSLRCFETGWLIQCASRNPDQIRRLRSFPQDCPPAERAEAIPVRPVWTPPTKRIRRFESEILTSGPGCRDEMAAGAPTPIAVTVVHVSKLPINPIADRTASTPASCMFNLTHISSSQPAPQLRHRPSLRSGTNKTHLDAATCELEAAEPQGPDNRQGVTSASPVGSGVLGLERSLRKRRISVVETPFV